jgi:hypothetical protein
MGPDLTSAYATATEKSFWPLVSAHLAAAAPFMEATRHRNKDVDCQAIPVLEHAAKTTDSVESQFAVYDYALRLGAGFGATAGVAQATSMRAMDTPGAMKDKAAATVKAKSKRGECSGALHADQVDDQVAEWDVMNFFSLPADQRWTIIQSVRKNYNVNAISERQLLQKMDEAKAARVAAARQAEITKCMKRNLKYREFVNITAISSTAALEALAAQHTGSPAVLAEALRQQIRVRTHVYGIRAGLPYMSAKPGATDEDEAARLHTAFADLVRSALPVMPNAPAPHPVRDAAVAPSTLAVQLDISHMREISNAWKELVPLLNENGAFKAPRASGAKPRAKSARGPAASTTFKAPKAPKPRTPSASERALEGVEFEEDGVEWTVLTVRWSADSGALVVWYFDTLEAEKYEISEKAMLDAIENGSAFDCLEYSSVSEIKRWISGRA